MKTLIYYHIIVVAIAFVSCTKALRPDAKTTFDTFWTISSEDADPARIGDLRVILTSCEKGLTEYFPKQPTPLKVIAYGNRGAFVRGLKDEFGFPDEVAAYFSKSGAPRPLQGKMLVPPDQSAKNICHELVHHYLEGHTNREHLLTAKWLDEGSAVYFSNIIMGDGVNKSLDYFNTRRKGRILQLEQLSTEDEFHKLHSDPDLRQLAYLQSLSMVNFFLKRFSSNQYIQLLDQAKEISFHEAFSSVCGMPVEEFYDQWRSDLQGISSLYVLLEPARDKKVDGLPVVREMSLDNPKRKELETIFSRPFQRWTLELGNEARKLARKNCKDEPSICDQKYSHPAYFVIKKGGNRPLQGFAIESADGKVRKLPTVWYVELGLRNASYLMPHEYGHVMMFESLSGDMPEHPSTLPHTTGAITNDVIAFSEGWAIHFETLAADRRENSQLYKKMHRDSFPVDGPIMQGDSFVTPKDLMTYSQSYRRFTCVKENCFAHLPRTKEDLVAGRVPTADDLIARWTDTTHDPARLRSLEQMVASEGLIATLFYRLATAPFPNGPIGRKEDPPLPDPRRYYAFFESFHKLTEARVQKTPLVLAFLQDQLESAQPRERNRIARIALEVFHYSLTIPDAARLYADIHEAGHHMNLNVCKSKMKELAKKMAASVNKLVDNPSLLERTAAPELWLTNKKINLVLPIFGMKDIPLVFDLNTAPIVFLMTLPGVGFEQAKAIELARRRAGGFQSVKDLANVQGIGKKTLHSISRMEYQPMKRNGKK